MSYGILHVPSDTYVRKSENHLEYSFSSTTQAQNFVTVGLAARKVHNLGLVAKDLPVAAEDFKIVER